MNHHPIVSPITPSPIIALPRPAAFAGRVIAALATPLVFATLLALLMPVAPLHAQTEAPMGAISGAPAGSAPVAPSLPPGDVPPRAAAPPRVAPDVPVVSGDRLQQAGKLVEEAIVLAERNGRARVAVARGAAALLPRLDANVRDALATRWVRLVQSPSVPRAVRLDAYSTFFDVGARADAAFARRFALGLPDAAARAGAFIDLSEATERVDWTQSQRDIANAQQAARREPNLTQRARALTFIAYRMALMGGADSDAAIAEAVTQARLVGQARVRDYLLAEIVGAAAKTDLIMARRIAETITDEDLKNLATARVNIAQIAQTTLAASTDERVAALAKAAARYDSRAIPILIQLPPQGDVLKSLSDALPPIYPTARPAIDAALLERIWSYAAATEAGVQRDELQSRLARLMVLHDLWRGRDWGKQLAWRGGRVQVGAFLKAVAQARRSQVRAAPLQDLAERNVNRAIAQARTLAPAARAEALLLIAGQLLS